MRGHRVRASLAACVVGAALLVAPAGASNAGTAPKAAAPTGPCGLLAYPQVNKPVYQHIVVIMDENLSYASFNASTQAPYLHGLGAACGSEKNMHAATHPSQANYMAATSGVATGTGVHTANDNVFHQLQVAGKTWKNYAESMPSACSRSSVTAPAYKTGHVPAFWYTNLATPTNTCATNAVPLSPGLDKAIAGDSLPTYAWITPNACDDMHWLSGCANDTTLRVATGDAWLSALIPRLTAMPSYQAGKTLIIVTFDEGDEDSTFGVDCTSAAYYTTHPDCQIATVVVSPYVRPGATDSADHNLYALLATTEDILGLKRLGRAAGQHSLRPGLLF